MDLTSWPRTLWVRMVSPRSSDAGVTPNSPATALSSASCVSHWPPPPFVSWNCRFPRRRTAARTRTTSKNGIPNTPEIQTKKCAQQTPQWLDINGLVGRRTTTNPAAMLSRPLNPEIRIATEGNKNIPRQAFQLANRRASSAWLHRVSPRLR